MKINLNVLLRHLIAVTLADDGRSNAHCFHSSRKIEITLTLKKYISMCVCVCLYKHGMDTTQCLLIRFCTLFSLIHCDTRVAYHSGIQSMCEMSLLTGSHMCVNIDLNKALHQKLLVRKRQVAG